MSQNLFEKISDAALRYQGIDGANESFSMLKSLALLISSFLSIEDSSLVSLISSSDAPPHLYMEGRVRRSVRLSVGPSVCQSVHWSVTLLLKQSKMGKIGPNKIMKCTWKDYLDIFTPFGEN